MLTLVTLVAMVAFGFVVQVVADLPKIVKAVKDNVNLGGIDNNGGFVD